MEEWKDVIGYEGLYMVSSSGEIYSTISKKILRQTKSSTGYYHVTLYLDKKASCVNVHRIVADAFLPQKDNCPEINHIDGNKGNNSVINLERVSKSENAIHAYKTGLRKPPMQGRKGSQNARSKEILQYSIDGKYIRTWFGVSEAARAMGCTPASISGCINGKKRTIKGYIWRIKDSDNPPLTICIPEKMRHKKKKGYKQQNRRPMHRIQQISKTGVVIKIWSNYQELADNTGYDNGNIYKCINGKLKSAYGYIWRYDK